MPIVRPIGRPVVVTPEVPLRGDALPWDVQGGGSAPWTPAALGLDLWLDHAVGVARSGSAWTSWTSVVNGHAFAQGTGASQPVDRTIGAFTVPDFDGTDDFLQGPLASAIFGGSLSPIGIAAVVYADTLGGGTGANADGIIATATSNRFGLAVNTTTTTFWLFDVGGATRVATAGSALSTGTTTLVRGRFDNAAVIGATTDGGAEGTTATGAGHFAGNYGFNMLVGRQANGASTSFDGAIFAIFARRTQFSAGELASLASYCSTRWGAV